jgi:flagellar assembly protein FliH
MARERGFDGRIVTVGEPDFALGDVRLEWADGGVVRDRSIIEKAVAEALGIQARTVIPAAASPSRWDAQQRAGTV